MGNTFGPKGFSRGSSLHVSYEITAQGPRLVVVLNGVKTVDVQDSKHASGPFALQYASGVIKFRKVQIKPM